MKKKHTKKQSKTMNQVESYWKTLAIITGIVLLISLFFNLTDSSDEIGISEASDKAMGVINSQLLQPGTTATLIESSDEGSAYKLTIDIDGQNIDSYVSKDGNTLYTGAIELDNPPTQPSAPAPIPSAPVEVSVDDDEVKGDANAPVTIVEFSDFECPYCGRFYKDTYKQLMTEYVDTGKVKYVFRDFPLGFHSKAQKASEAAECAGDQGKYYDMHDTLFENQGALGISDLKGYAKDLGLNTATFDECLDSGKHADEVKKDMADGQAYGVTGTPAFFINGKLLSGAQPFSAFKQVIDAELN